MSTDRIMKSFAGMGVAVCMMMVPMTAQADVNGESNDGAGVVTSSRSFPSVASTRGNLAKEHVSTDVEQDAEWSGIENLNVPETKSQAQKDQEAAAAQAEKERQEAAERSRTLQSDTASASRSSQRESARQTYVEDDADVSADVSAMIDAAYALIGQHMDCTALVSAALAAAGIDFHGYPEDYINVGRQVTDGTLKPGDILIYRYTGGWNGGTHWDHVALYVGNGKAIHGGWNGTTVALAGMLDPDVIVRVF